MVSDEAAVLWARMLEEWGVRRIRAGGGAAVRPVEVGVRGDPRRRARVFYLQSRLAHRRCDLEEACGLVRDALQALLGHAAAFAHEIGAELPPIARQVAQRRRPPLA